MQPIELTKEHKDKLLEMCNKLFPEYTVEIELEPDYEGLQYFVQLNKSESIKTWIYIHWFEFVILHLATTIYNLKGYNTLGSSNNTTITQYRGYICQEVDPIDFLYEEFQSLKI